MAARLCAAVTRSVLLRSRHTRALTDRTFLERISSANASVGLAARSLHTKVLDKETNWDAQRAANRRRIDGHDDLLKATLPNKFKSLDIPTSSTDDAFRTKSVEEPVGFENNDDADFFGGSSATAREDDGDLIEEEFTSNPPSRSQRLPQIQYIRMIKAELMAKNIPRAIDVVEKRMKQDRVKPESYTYNLLISGCAKAGYTRKAFSLFNRMRQRGLRVTGGTYTSLFNACANAPTAADGLNRANHVREIMLEKGVEPNLKNYNAMIKAFGRWGDVKTAYQLADEMKEKRIQPSLETYNFLLQACASDTKFGFRHGLLTWHKMLKSGFKPDYYTFNTVLRCVRDCSFGDLETMKDLIVQILGEHHAQKVTASPTVQSQEERRLESNLQSSTTNQLSNEDNTQEQEGIANTSTTNPFKTTDSLEERQNQLESSKANPFKTAENEIRTEPNELKEPVLELVKNCNSTTDVTTRSIPKDGLDVPNLLASRPHLGSMISLSEITRPHERFLLLGGLSGFLDLMKQNGVTPNIQMFTMMLEVIPPTNSAEKQVLSYIRRIGLKADIDFFNVLIKKRSMRFDYDGAKEVLSMINTAGLSPDIVTYGVLALGCQTQEEARELLQEMRNKGVRMNIQILGAMLRQGCAQHAFPYICEVMQISLDEQIKPNDIFLRHLHDFYTRCARAIDARHPATKSKKYRKQHGKFCDKLRLYQEEHGIAGLKLNDAIRIIKERPYQQYKEAKIEGLEPEKNETLVQKQKIRKYIKKIKISNLKGDEPAEENVQRPTESTQKVLVS